jgi:hypothetical protein
MAAVGMWILLRAYIDYEGKELSFLNLFFLADFIFEDSQLSLCRKSSKRPTEREHRVETFASLT